VLLADIGGTNDALRDAVRRNCSTIAHLAVSDYDSFREALDKYLGNCGSRTNFSAAILAVSGPVQNGPLRPHNNSWGSMPADLRNAYGFSAVRLVK